MGEAVHLRMLETGEGHFIQGVGDTWISRNKTSKRNGDVPIEELWSNGGENLNKPFQDALLHSSQNTGQVLLMIEVVKRPEPISRKLTSMSHCARAELLSNSKSAVCMRRLCELAVYTSLLDYIPCSYWSSSDLELNDAISRLVSSRLVRAVLNDGMKSIPSVQ